LSIHIG